MDAVKPTTLTIAGVPRTLRGTLGARRIIRDAFGMNLQEALQKHDAEAFPQILHALMHDEQGNPPEMSVNQIAFSLAASESPAILAAIIEAFSNGGAEKNVIEAKIREELAKSTSSIFLPSPTSVSESEARPSSSGDSLNASSSPSASSSEAESESAIIAPV